MAGKYKKLLLAIPMALLGIILLVTPVFAIADPDTPSQVGAVYVYNDLLEDGDAGVLVDYYIDYAATPTETATEAFMAVFVDTDGITQLKSVAPYSYDTSGYGRGLIWLYFDASEVTGFGIDVANIALYEIWLAGNPTLTWVPGPDPPKTIAGIDYWMPSGASAATLVALRVLYYADVLELIWSVDLIQTTALGSRLTAAGEDYFTNVIQFLRTIAPSAFASGELGPTLEDLDYDTTFGATMTNGTGTVAGSPITLTAGANTVNILTNGTFTLELNKGTSGTVVNAGGVVTGSPVDIVWGTNTITTTGAGNLTVTVNLINTQTGITGTVTGTGLDLSTAAALFGMSTMMFSSLVWLIMTIIICAAVYKGIDSQREGFSGGGKIVLLVFDICIIGGAVLGLMPILAAILMFVGFGAFTGYVLFFRHASV